MRDPLNPDRLQNRSRRELLKRLLSSGMLSASIILPGKWSKPLIKKGFLPGHAQTSRPTPTATNTPTPTDCPYITEPTLTLNQQEQWVATFNFLNLPAGFTVTYVQVMYLTGIMPVRMGTTSQVTRSGDRWTAVFGLLEPLPDLGHNIYLLVGTNSRVAGCGQGALSPDFPFIVD